MSDTEPIERWTPRRRTRRGIAIGTLVGCGLIIFYTVIHGDPGNTLHQSALSWAFTLAGATIGGYIFGAVWDNAQVLKTGGGR
jgi:hypothetical protein